MTIRQTFAEMDNLMRQKGDILSDISRAMDSATATGGIGDGMPRPTSPTPKVERYGTYCADLRKKVESIDKKLELFKEDILPTVRAIPEGSERKALWLRYVDLLPVRQVAMEMHYERESMYRLIKNTLKRWVF